MIIYDDDAGRCEDLANVIVLVLKISPHFLSASSSSSSHPVSMAAPWRGLLKRTNPLENLWPGWALRYTSSAENVIHPPLHLSILPLLSSFSILPLVSSFSSLLSILTLILIFNYSIVLMNLRWFRFLFSCLFVCLFVVVARCCCCCCCCCCFNGCSKACCSCCRTCTECACATRNKEIGNEMKKLQRTFFKACFSSTTPPVLPSVRPSVRPNIRSFYPFLNIFIRSSIHQPICPSVHPPIRLFIRPSIHPSSVHLSIHPSTHPSIHLFIHPSNHPPFIVFLGESNDSDSAVTACGNVNHRRRRRCSHCCYSSCSCVRLYWVTQSKCEVTNIPDEVNHRRASMKQSHETRGCHADTNKIHSEDSSE